MATTKKLVSDEPIGIEFLDQMFEIQHEENDITNKKKIRKIESYVTIRHNASEGYLDKRKDAVAGSDLYPGGFLRDMKVAAIVRGNRNSYLTGLDPKDHADQADKDFLTICLPELHRAFGEDVLDPFNEEFWSTRKLVISEDNTLMNLSDPEVLLNYWCIKGGGYPMIAKSPDVVKRERFYLEEPGIDYDSTRADDTREKDKAIATLAQIEEAGNGYEIMFYLHKNLITVNEGVTKNTPKINLYKALRDFIDGLYTDKNKKKTPKLFLDAYNLYKTNKKRIMATAISNDAVFLGLIVPDKQGFLNSTISRTNFKTKDKKELVDIIMRIDQQDELVALAQEVEKKWNKNF